MMKRRVRDTQGPHTSPEQERVERGLRRPRHGHFGEHILDALVLFRHHAELECTSARGSSGSSAASTAPPGRARSLLHEWL